MWSHLGEPAYSVTTGESRCCMAMLSTFANAGGAAASVVVAAVLLVAARAKAKDRVGTAEDLNELGLIGAQALAVVVPATEVLTAIALLAAPPVGGPIAFALLAGFTVVLWRARRFGRQTGQTASCACFGGSTSEPISGRHFARNALLMALAAAATASQWTVFHVIG